jgi:glycosyltransferase involved in cell wall biosynthesis
MRVVISNATRHHSYQAALAAFEAGLLEQFIAGGYYQPQQFSYRLIETLGDGLGFAGQVRRMKSRVQPGIPPERVTSLPWPDVLEQVWRGSKLLGALVHPDSITYLAHAWFDFQAARFHLPECDLLHAFEQCALYSLRRAKQRGAVTLLDEPVLHRAAWDRLEAEERRRLGLPQPKRPLGYHRHIERKYRELELADYILVGLEFVRRSYIEAGYPAERIFLVPYGVDVDAAGPPGERPRRRPFRILFVGQISWYKGLHYFLDAYDRVRLDDVELTAIGLVHDQWMPYFRERFARVKKPFRYLGTVPRTEMARHLAEADVFVFPSLGGGIGLAVYEAMAAGLPVITSDGDVVIRDGVDGLVIPPQEMERWAAAIEWLAGDDEQRRRLGTSAAARVRTFTWAAYRAGIRDAYLRIAEREGISASSGAPRELSARKASEV